MPPVAVVVLLVVGFFSTSPSAHVVVVVSYPWLGGFCLAVEARRGAAREGKARNRGEPTPKPKPLQWLVSVSFRRAAKPSERASKSR